MVDRHVYERTGEARLDARYVPDTGWTFRWMAGLLVNAVDVGPDDRVLDVACRTGNVAITADRP